MEKSKPIEIITLMATVITVWLLYERWKHDKRMDADQKKLWALQAELHKEQIKEMKNGNS
jgi:hypothetical protein